MSGRFSSLLPAGHGRDLIGRTLPIEKFLRGLARLLPRVRGGQRGLVPRVFSRSLSPSALPARERSRHVSRAIPPLSAPFPDSVPRYTLGVNPSLVNEVAYA